MLTASEDADSPPGTRAPARPMLATAAEPSVRDPLLSAPHRINNDCLQPTRHSVGMQPPAVGVVAAAGVRDTVKLPLPLLPPPTAVTGRLTNLSDRYTVQNTPPATVRAPPVDSECTDRAERTNADCAVRDCETVTLVAVRVPATDSAAVCTTRDVVSASAVTDAATDRLDPNIADPLTESVRLVMPPDVRSPNGDTVTLFATHMQRLILEPVTKSKLIEQQNSQNDHR